MDREFRIIDEMAATNTALRAVGTERKTVMQAICRASGALVAGHFSQLKNGSQQH